FVITAGDQTVSGNTFTGYASNAYTYPVVPSGPFGTLVSSSFPTGTVATFYSGNQSYHPTILQVHATSDPGQGCFNTLKVTVAGTLYTLNSGSAYYQYVSATGIAYWEWDNT